MTEEDNQVIRSIARMEAQIGFAVGRVEKLEEKSQKVENLLWRIMWVLVFTLVGVIVQSAGLQPVLKIFGP